MLKLFKFFGDPPLETIHCPKSGRDPWVEKRYRKPCIEYKVFFKDYDWKFSHTPPPYTRPHTYTLRLSRFISQNGQFRERQDETRILIGQPISTADERTWGVHVARV